MEQKVTSTNIKVAIRVRPLIPSEKKKKLRVQWTIQDNVIYHNDECGQTGELYSFDHVFGMDKTNLDVYNEVVQDFVSSSLNGLNSTIFAYGQTSSGKTYTMLGNKNDPGVMSLAVENIFDSISNSLNKKYLLRVSYIEIYNEKINDLIDPTNKDIKIREFFNSTVGLQNVKEEIVSSKEDVYEYLKIGNLNRHIGTTQANDWSSRSHTIFRIGIESTDFNDFDSKGPVQVSQLNFVDLAGSERVAQTRATGMRLKEGSHINKSLSALGLVIKQLSDGQEFVNFRDSKLTRLLQDSLGGNSQTLIIATVTVASVDDTSSTLAFAQRAKTVKNKPHVNTILTEADISKRYELMNAQLKTQLGEYTKEIDKLRKQMEMLEDFHSYQHSPKFDIPKRRHTIGFSQRKKTLIGGGCGVDKVLPLEDKSIKTSAFVNPLETIEEVEYNPSTKTPVHCLRLRLLTLEQEYEELRIFANNVNTISDEQTKEMEDLKTQLKLKNNSLLDCETKHKIELEEVTDIKNQLHTLKHILSKTSRISDILTEESTSELLGNFNRKVEKSMVYIKEEILKQMKFVDTTDISIPNELNSFNTLLNELHSFEKDVSSDLIKNIKEQNVEDLDFFVKIYEALLRKNELIRKVKFNENNVAETRVKILEKELSKKSELLIESQKNCEKLQQNLKDKKVEISILLEKLKRTVDMKNNSRIDTTDSIEDEMQELPLENETVGQLERIDSDNLSLKSQISKLTAELNELKSEIVEKDEKIANLQQKIETSENQKDASEIIKVSELEAFKETKEKENSLLLSENQSLKGMISDLKNNVNKLNIEISEKDETIVDLAKKNEKDADLEKQNLELRNEINAFKQKIDIELPFLLSETKILEKEIFEKNKYVSELETFKETIEKENSLLLSENQSLKGMISDLKDNINKLNIEISKKDKTIIDLTKKNEKDTDLEKQNSELINKINVLKLQSTEKSVKLSELEKKFQLIQQNENDPVSSLDFKLLKKKNSELEDCINVLNLVINEKTKAISDLEKECKQLNQKCIEIPLLNIDNSSLKKQISELNNEITKLNSVLMEKNQNISELEEKYSTFNRYNQEIETFKNENFELNKKLSDKNKTILDLEKKCEAFNRKINEEIPQLISEIESLKKEKLQIQDNLEKLFYEVTEQKKYISNLEENVIHLKEINGKEISEKQLLLDDIKKLRLDLSEKNKMKSDLEEKYLELKQQIEKELSEKQMLLDKITNLNSELNEKNQRITTLEQNITKSLENNQQSFESDQLILQLEEKSKTIMHLETQNEKLHEKYVNSSIENRRLKSEIAKLQNIGDERTRKDLLRQKKSERSGSNKENECFTLQDKEKLENEISRLKTALCECRINRSTLERDYTKLLEQIEELSDSKTKIENFFITLIDCIIREQKMLLLKHHSQEQRDYLKIVLKDIQTNNRFFKSQFSLLQNRENHDFEYSLRQKKENYDIDSIKENILEFVRIFKEYFYTEKSFLEVQIKQLETEVEKYLKEAMTLKEELDLSKKEKSSVSGLVQLKNEGQFSPTHERKYNQMKKVCKIRQQKIDELKEEIKRLKSISQK